MNWICIVYYELLKYSWLEKTHRGNGNPGSIHPTCVCVCVVCVCVSMLICNNSLVRKNQPYSPTYFATIFSRHWPFICRVAGKRICTLHIKIYYFIFYIHSKYSHTILKWKRPGALFYIICFYCFIVLNEAVKQLTELRWWRHRVRCCSNCKCVLAFSEVCTWSPDLPSTYFQVRENVVRVLRIEKRPICWIVCVSRSFLLVLAILPCGGCCWWLVYSLTWGCTTKLD